MKWFFIVIVFPFFCFASDYKLDIIDSRSQKGWTTIVYTKENGEVCKLNIKISDLNRGWDIEDWLDDAESTNCNSNINKISIKKIGMDKN